LDGTVTKAEMMQWMGSDTDAASFWSSARHFQITSIKVLVFRVRQSSRKLAWSGLMLMHMVQGSNLEQWPFAVYEVLKFIRTIRLTGWSPVTFIGISRTGLTAKMVCQITRAIVLLPMSTNPDSETFLEMQQVVTPMFHLSFSALTWRRDADAHCPGCTW
jgi:hypothetical protein